MKNPLTMIVRLDMPTPHVERDINKLLDRLVAKMEGRLHAKEDVFTLAYVVMRKTRDKLLSWYEGDVMEVEITYEGAAALAYELKTYPAGPKKGVLVQLLGEIDQGLREKRQHDRDLKRKTKQRNRPTVRESRGLRPPREGGADGS